MDYLNNNENYEYDSNEIIDEEDQEIVNDNLKDEESKLGMKNDGNEKLPPNIQIKPPGTKQKRRSKNDCNGRDYVCGCGKTYLSYPALYTHIKTKHNGKTPDGTNANHFDNGKGRGRPRKNFLVNEENVRRPNDYKDEEFDEKNPEMKEFYKNFGSNDNKKEVSLENTEEIYMTIYKNKGLLGNTNNIFDAFPSLTKEHYRQIYNKIRNLIENERKINSILDKNAEEEEKETKLCCDDIFGLFLIEISKKINPSFMKIVVIFLRFYRECMNKLGWELLNQFKDLQDEPTFEDFCAAKNGEYLPTISNDFITLFLPKRCPEFNKELAIILPSHFNHWLLKNQFTHIKLNIN